MSNELFFLRPNVVIEPLVDRWYAWTHLISPATAAMNTVGRHLKIMNSYIKSPMLHASAVRDPKMLGGPFMDYPTQRVQEIKELKKEIETRQAPAIELAAAILELEQMLRQRATGYSLETLYEKVPDVLKGYVELVYDLRNNPSYVFYEPLLYKSRFYARSSQSIAMWITENDQRPFCLSTPQLEAPGILHIPVAFDHPGIDALSKMKREPGCIDRVAALLGISAAQRALFDTFFTRQEHPQYRKYHGDKARMRYLGHACILIETSEVSILVDPLISYYGYESSVDHYSDVDLPDVIDYVLITHNHQDHVVFETLLPLRHKIRHIIVPATNSGALQDPSLKLALNNIGFNNVTEIDTMEEIRYENCVITGLPFTGEHCDLNIRTKTCYHIAIGQFKFLFVADSRVLEQRIYKHIHQIMGDIDVLFLGMECEGAPLSWLYGPLFTDAITRENDQSRRLSGCDCERGMHLVDIFHPKEVYVYAMGQEPWLQFISSIRYTETAAPIVQSDKLVAACMDRRLIAERLYGEKELLYDYEKLHEIQSVHA